MEARVFKGGLSVALGAAAIWMAAVEVTAEGSPVQPVPTMVPGTASAKETLSPPLTDIAGLAKAGLSDDVMLAYIRKSPASFSVSSDQLVALRELGLSPRVLKAILEHTPANSSEPARRLPSDSTSAQPSDRPKPALIYIPAPPPVPSLVSDGDFYRALAPYGRWFQVPGQGWCWRPLVAASDPSWQPYGTNGRWLWSDCGWYWDSDYPWGWGPFHYGRWQREARYGWMWHPAQDWSPAWVSWRQHAGTIGWAPLPPGSGYELGSGWSFKGRPVRSDFGFELSSSVFTFVPSKRFQEDSVLSYRLEGEPARTAFKQSTVVNNYRLGLNNRIINFGPGMLESGSGTNTASNRIPVLDRVRNPHLSSPSSVLWSGLGRSPMAAQISAVLLNPTSESGPADAEVQFSPTPPVVGVGALAPNFSQAWGGGGGWGGPGWSDPSGNNPASSGDPAVPIVNDPVRPPTPSSGGANGNSATPWLVAGQQVSPSAGSPFGVVGIPISAGSSASPWQTAGQATPPPAAAPLVPVGSGTIGRGTLGHGTLGGLPASTSSEPWVPPGESAASGTLPAFGVHGVPVAANDGKNPFLPVGQQPASGNAPPFGVPGVPIVPNSGRNPFLPFGQTAMPSGPPFAPAPSVPRMDSTAGSTFPALPASPTLPAAPRLPGGPFLSGSSGSRSTSRFPATGSWPSAPSAASWPSAPSWPSSSGAGGAAGVGGAAAGGGHGGGGGGGHH